MKYLTSKLSEKNKKRINILLDLIIALFVLFYLFIFLFEFDFCTSGSMEPTFKVGGIALTSKFAYKNNDVKRGDFIIFMRDGEKHGKRVIGVGGDEIEFHDGYVYINGEILDESEYLDSNIDTNSTKTFTVPDGEYFVMGDNRENSFDSRMWEDPYIAKDEITGKIIFILNDYPFKRTIENEAVDTESSNVDDKTISTTESPKEIQETASFVVASQDYESLYLEYFYCDEIIKGDDALELVKNSTCSKKEADEGNEFVVVKYATTANPREEYVDIKMLGTDGKCLTYNDKTYSSRCYDIYNDMTYNEGWYENVYAYYEIPKGVDRYLLKVGYATMEEYYGANKIPTGNYLIINKTD